MSKKKRKKKKCKNENDHEWASMGVVYKDGKLYKKRTCMFCFATRYEGKT